jgi:hypothetical protein
MKRKDFIRNTAIAAVTIPSLIGTSYKSEQKKGFKSHGKCFIGF